jgi:ATP-dependent protease HslVU (ClpYQ) peptidase subunit
MSGKYMVAFAGHIRTGQLLYPESGFTFPDDIYQIPNHIYLWLREFEVIGKDEAQMAIIASNFLIATKDRMYEVLIDMQISEIDPNYGFTAVGSGCPYAYGSLYTSSLDKSMKDRPKDRIKLAMEAAAEYVKTVGPPYSFYSYTEAKKLLKSKPAKKVRTKRKTRTKKV